MAKPKKDRTLADVPWWEEGKRWEQWRIETLDKNYFDECHERTDRRLTWERGQAKVREAKAAKAILDDQLSLSGEGNRNAT